MHAPEQLALRRSHSEGDQLTFFVLYFVEMIEPPPGIAQFSHDEQTLFGPGHF
ncbi:putative d-cysteine desulfhydrase [Escherichia coli 3-073-06_S1_C2]|nr:putative d-cysteine desulfhydrase [Escherichia coli 3-073-06_S1_C2]